MLTRGLSAATRAIAAGHLPNAAAAMVRGYVAPASLLSASATQTLVVAESKGTGFIEPDVYSTPWMISDMEYQVLRRPPTNQTIERPIDQPTDRPTATSTHPTAPSSCDRSCVP